MRLIPLSPSEGVLETLRPDTDQLSFDGGIGAIGLGDHAVCNGTIYLMRVSDESHTIRCDRCGFRTLVPAAIRTVGDLCLVLKEQSTPKVPLL